MGYIYIIRGTNTKKDFFKLGLHNGTKEQLYNRYRTYMIEPDILRFYLTDDEKKDEKILLTQLDKYRIDRKKSKSEWLKIKKKKLLKITDIYFDQYKKSSCFC